MKIKDLLDEEVFSTIRNEVSEFVTLKLKKYIQELPELVTQKTGKEIFDVVWGPIEFNSAEIIILDSPLLQRLRKIKHLGLASYVYCSADYSRFSHTIGVFYIANRMAQIIQKNIGNNKCNYDFSQIARLAALFHDTGHMYFSHTSEYYFVENTSFSRHKEVKAALERFGTVIGKRVALHELFSVMIVYSDTTRELLQHVAPSLEGVSTKNFNELDRMLEYISCMIVGVANGGDILPFSQIINGSVDADKCDYLSRDSHATNVPVAVDIFRLIHKLSVDEKQNYKAPNDLWIDDSTTKIFYIPTIKSSAIEALNQLLMARTIMFNSVYYHQKVRTAEVTMRNILAEMNNLKIFEVTNFTNILEATDDIFGSQCYKILCNSVNDADQDKLKAIISQLNDLNDRNIMKRACAISNENIIADKYKLYEFEKDFLKLNKPDKIRNIEKLTKNEYLKICDLLKYSESQDLKFLIVEFPRCLPEYSKVDTLISYGNGQTKKASDVFQTATWIGSKEGRNKEHYLVGNCKHRELAFLAIQKVLFDIYQVKLNNHAAVYSKTKLEDLMEQREKLFSKDYYKKSLELVSDIIFKPHDDDFKEICEKYQSFEGENGYKVDLTSLENFLRQFLKLQLTFKDVQLLVDGLTRILKKALFINRAYFVEGFNKLFKEIGIFKDIMNLCPLGGDLDSAKHLMYYVNDIKKNFPHLRVFSSLHELLKDGSTTENVILFDDGAYSGTQVISIFQEYIGLQANERITTENHVQALTDQEKEALKKKKIILLYICFNEDNEKKIKSELRKLGINDVEIYFYYNMNTKIFDLGNNILKDPKQSRDVKKHLKKVGTEILRSAKSQDGILKSNWPDERIIKASLGYNDAQQMVILQSSVPTYTLTPFWLSNGTFCGKEWIPLFRRTIKLD